MAVIVLALFAVFVGFILIALMGRSPPAVLLEEGKGDGGARPDFASLEDLEEAVRGLAEAQGMTVDEVRKVSDDEFEILASAGGGLGKGMVVFHCVWTEEPVGGDRVSALLGAVRGERALKGVFITTGYFTADVHNIVEGPPVDLVNGEQLGKLLHEHGVSPAK
ncbi:MAG: restriction endonuclease [Bdellovibrionota bacterium]